MPLRIFGTSFALVEDTLI